MVRPTPTTATRTVAITQEGSRDDAIETVRRLLGPTPTAIAVTTPNTTVNIPRMDLAVSTSTVQLTHTITETRLSSPPAVSRVTRTTTPVGMATPISQDLIWPGHPDIQGTSLFPQNDDPATVAAGLDPEERWKIHHPCDIPGVKRPTMETPGNLRRMAECETLVESLQTMEYLTEFPTLEERQDYRRFPPRYGDPHYHPSRLKRSGDNGQSRREGEDRPPNDRPPPGRELWKQPEGHLKHNIQKTQRPQEEPNL